MAWYSKDADQTYLIWFGCALFAVIAIGLFVLHGIDSENSLLSPEIVMAMITGPITIVGYAIGRKHGAEAEMNGNESDDKDDSKETTEPFKIE